MRTTLLVLTLSVGPVTVCAQTAGAQAATAQDDICISIDETHDTLSPQERVSAKLLLARQFELAGRRVVADGCTATYTLSHVELGEHIFVTLAGAGENREGTAVGLDDLPALYSQMVRSIVTGRPMTGFNVVDRTNVTAAQTSSNRVHTDRYAYARLGYGAVFADRAYRMPGFGFGYRVELDSFGVDVSFLNIQASGDGYQSSGLASAASFLKLQGLYFAKPTANASAYFGGGLSWGGIGTSGGRAYRSDTYTSGWHGSGLQGELTMGYELPRASTLRIFLEGNGVLPFYKVTSETYSYFRGASPPTVAERYTPSFVVSVGVGWQRNRGDRP